MRAGLYARVSTDDKGQDPEVQLAPMRELAAARGWAVTEYVDWVYCLGQLTRLAAMPP